MPGKRLNKDITQLVYINYYKGKSHREIAKMFSLNLRTVYNVINRAEKEGRLEPKATPGRPKKVTRRIENKMIDENPLEELHSVMNVDTMEWNVAEVFKVLKLYRQFNCLWDIKSSYYKRNDTKRNAWQKIAKIMNKDEEEIKKKVKNLRCAYVVEKKKVESSKRSGSSAEDLYLPNLYYYNEMSFLDSAVMYRKPTSNMETPESHNSTIEFKSEDCVLEELNNLEESTLQTESQDSMFFPSVLDTPAKYKSFKRKNTEREEKFNNAIDAFVRQADMSCSIMSSIKNNEETVYTAFAKSIALQLAQLSFELSAEAMSDIQNILTTKMIAQSRNDILKTAVYESEILKREI